MLRALLTNFGDRPVVFWLDQLSIDQSDSAQKVQATANMDTIYRNASKVLILLEDFDINPDAERSLQLLATNPLVPESTSSNRMHLSGLVLPENVSSWCSQGITQHLYQFIEFFFRCIWFTRAWCNQEYQLNAHRTYLFVGHINDHYLSSVCGHPGFLTFGSGVGTNNSGDISRLYLALLFVELERLGCSHLRDIISIALNTSGIFLSFVGDV
jgi:hypothetical protein